MISRTNLALAASRLVASLLLGTGCNGSVPDAGGEDDDPVV